MKKYGKFEKQAEVKPEKQHKVKSPLMQTYVTSLLCMILSVTMFFGTSFAWFTSEVDNVGNEIYIGTLDVELEKKPAEAGTEEEWDSLSAVGTDGVNTTKLFDDKIRWEPGYTMLETVRVVNQGDLAFNYELTFTDGVLVTDEQDTTDETADAQSLAAIGDSFEVWFYNQANTTGKTDPENYAQITAADSGWTKAGTLAEVLAGKAVFAGTMAEADVFDSTTSEIKDTAHTYTIALHMLESATGKDLMGKKISLNVKLVAYQLTSERDAFGEDHDYDKVIAVHNVTELTEVLTAGGNVILMNDIALQENEQLTIPADVTVMLDLNGYTLSQTKEQNSVHAMITNNGTLTISDSSSTGDGKISYADTATYSADNGYASNTIRNEGVLNITGGTVENVSSDNVKNYGYPHAIDVYQGSVTNIYGGTVKSENYDCIRMFCNSTTEATTVNIYGGNIVNRVSFQNPSSNAAGYGILNITGGTFTTTGNVTANVRLLNFSSNYSNMKATVSGGTFDKGIMAQNHATGITLGMDWLTVTNLTLTATETDNLWTIS